MLPNSPTQTIYTFASAPDSSGRVWVAGAGERVRIGGRSSCGAR